MHLKDYSNFLKFKCKLDPSLGSPKTTLYVICNYRQLQLQGKHYKYESIISITWEKHECCLSKSNNNFYFNSTEYLECFSWRKKFLTNLLRQMYLFLKESVFFTHVLTKQTYIIKERRDFLKKIFRLSFALFSMLVASNKCIFLDSEKLK